MKGKVQCPLGQQRGRLTPLLERRKIISLIHEAVINGARKSQACRCIGISVRTLQRWTNGKVITTDRRSDWICPYISRHLLSLNPLLACCRRYSRGER
ncbi:TPA: helix-turn-helix domain-containing protein [Escherichia coli]|nr:helix-turn-helix domain-containing protein [Escherichia coli]